MAEHVCESDVIYLAGGFHKSFVCGCGTSLSTDDVLHIISRLSIENRALQKWKQLVIKRHKGSPEPHEPEGWTIIKNKTIYALSMDAELGNEEN